MSQYTIRCVKCGKEFTAAPINTISRYGQKAPTTHVFTCPHCRAQNRIQVPSK